MAVQCLGTLIYSLPPVKKKGHRELEKVSLKLAKSECSVLFNGVCLSENILPNYTNTCQCGKLGNVGNKVRCAPTVIKGGQGGEAPQ